MKFYYASRLISGIRRHGVQGALVIIGMRIYAILDDILFDFQYETDTRKWVDLNDLSITSDNKKSGILYVPSPVWSSRKLFSKLSIPTNSILVDFGCGKGRVLMIASEFGFKKVKGVDFSSDLCKIAINNCNKYKEKNGNNTEYQIFESDVVEYNIKGDENFFYLYNPFDDKVLDQVLNNIILSITENPRRVWIIYREAIYHNLIQDKNEFKNHFEIALFDKKIFVYTNEEK